ncbi:DNA-binding transcriptional regulator MetR [Leclercia adecarboxylata]|uniref:DNA-binding transcriptional regulator MetR n=1 Tax=Leclercia adecarboxylata TaxID=83655 RepID=A0A4U9IVT9_9ENTR|nr:DNA-binding transcriptional regulator MetR [Leclercia adecarboxylata]
MDFKSGVTFDPQPSLVQGELDLVMTSDILPRSGLHYSPMFDFEVRLVLAPDHPLARENTHYAGRSDHGNAADLPGAAQSSGYLASLPAARRH